MTVHQPSPKGAFPESRTLAANLAHRGFFVFPLKPGDKLPALKGWQNWATKEPGEVLFKWPMDRPDYNVGIRTDGLVVVDVDTYKSPEWRSELAKLGVLPETFTVRTARGGLHLYFRNTDGRRIKGGAHTISKDGRESYAVLDCKGIDIRATGGLTVGPGSTFEGKPYVIEKDVPVAELPEHLYDDFTITREKAADAGKVPEGVEIDEPERVAEATVYLSTKADLSVEGSGGNTTAFRVACRVLDFGLSKETALELMFDNWNDRCEPPWSAEELERLIDNAAQYRQDPIGREQLQRVATFSEIEPPPSASLLEFPADISLEEILKAKKNELIRDLISPGDIGVLYGPPAVGKTFVALDLAWHIALGRDIWHGRKVQYAAPILYVSLEGLTGFKKRQMALVQAMGDPERNFARITCDVSLVRDKGGENGVQKIIEASQELHKEAGQPVGMIVIDTLARAIAGDDENSADSMASFVQNRAQRIARETGAFVLVVHHPNKNGDMRGSTVLMGAADLVLCSSVIQPKEEDNPPSSKPLKPCQLVAEKVKDGEDGLLFQYMLKQVQVAEDPDAGPVTSCVVNTDPPEGPGSEIIKTTKRLIKQLIDSGDNWSDSSKARNYAPRKLHELDDRFTVADYADTLSFLNGKFVAVEIYENNGKSPRRYILIEPIFQSVLPPPAAPDGSPDSSASDGSDGCPTVPAETVGSHISWGFGAAPTVQQPDSSPTTIGAPKYGTSDSPTVPPL